MSATQNLEMGRHIQEFNDFDHNKYDSIDDKKEAALRFLQCNLTIDGKKVANKDIYAKCGISERCGEK